MLFLLQNKIISREEQKTLLSWIYENEDKFVQNPVGPNRKFYIFNDDSLILNLFWEVKNRIIKKERINEWYDEPMYKDYIGWITNNGFIHEHIDLNVGDFNHVRYNLVLSKPHRGGNAIYNNKKINMQERMYYRCNSGTEFHSCEKVIGEKPRIVISYGFLIPNH